MLRTVIAVFLAVFLTACDSSSTNRDVGVTTTQPLPPLAAAPEPETMVSMDVNAMEGGTLTSSDGALMMTLAPMAVTSDTTITVEALPASAGQAILDQLPAVDEALEPLLTYQFGPAGTEFTEPVLVEVVVPVDVPEVAEGEVLEGLFAVLNSGGEFEEALQQTLTVNENGEAVIQVYVPHFSDLVVASTSEIKVSEFTLIAPDQVREGIPEPIRLELSIRDNLSVRWQKLTSSSPNIVVEGLEGQSSVFSRGQMRRLRSQDGLPSYVDETTISCIEGDGEEHRVDFYSVHQERDSSDFLKVDYITEFSHTLTCLPAFDETPDPFEFSDQFNVPLDSEVISDPITITGIDRGLVSTTAGHPYSIGCTGEFVGTPAFINNGETLCVKHTSAAEFDTQTETVVNVGTATATFSSFTRRNEAPVANDDEYTVSNTVLTVPAPGLLANDTDLDGDEIFFAVASLPLAGSLNINEDGGFEYIAFGDESNVITFTYQIEDSNGVRSNEATVTINQIGDATPPVGSPDEFSVAKNDTLRIAAADLLVNDESNTTVSSAQLISGDAEIEVANDGGITVEPADDFVGEVVIEYVIRDFVGNLSFPITIRVEVFDTNATPIAANDEYTVEQDTVLFVPAPGVLGNDTDANGDSLTTSVVQTTQNGTLVLGLNGAFDYTPNSGFVGSDSFIYDAVDPDGASDRADVVIMVSEKPEDPCENEQVVTAVKFDLGASNDSGDSIPPDTIVPLRDIAGGIVVAVQPDSCSVVHLSGTIYVKDFGGPFPKPTRDENDALGESCGHGEVITITECLDPLQKGEIPEGLQSVLNPVYGAEDEAVERVSIISQVESVIVVSSPRALTAGENTASVSTLGSETVFGPLVFTGIQPTSSSDASQLLDLTTGELVRVDFGSFTQGPQFAVKEIGVSDEAARTWIVSGNGQRVVEWVASRDPNHRNYNSAIATGVDGVPVGYQGNFLGEGTGFISAHNSVLVLSSFATPAPAIQGSFFNDAENYIVQRGSFPGMTGNIISAAAQSSEPEPAVLAVEAGAPGALWYHPDSSAGSGTGVKVVDLGNDPNVVRCIDEAICVVVNASDSTLTTFTWDGVNSPVEIETVAVATNPGLPDLVKQTTGYRAAVTGDGNELIVLDIAGNGGVTQSQSVSLDASCIDPADPVWFLDPSGSKLIVPCPGNGFSDGTKIAQYLIVAPD